MTAPPDPERGPTPEDLVDAVSLRYDLLRELDDAGEPVEKRTLVDRLDVSRSTVDRGLRRFDALGLVTAAGEGTQSRRRGGSFAGSTRRSPTAWGPSSRPRTPSTTSHPTRPCRSGSWPTRRW